LRNKKLKFNVIEKYEDITFSLKTLNRFAQLLFFILLFTVFPKTKGWIWFLILSSLGIYILFFEFLPRLFISFNREASLNLSLPFVKIIVSLITPLLFVLRFLKPKIKESKIEGDIEEQLRLFIGEGQQEGIIEKEDGELIESVVEFGDTLVKEIMTPRVEMACIKRDATIKELKDFILKVKHSRIPVYKDRIDNIEGIILAKDLLKFWGDKYSKSPITPLIRPVFFVPESMNISELLKEFQRRRQKLAIVVDEYGGVSGLVTMEDIVEEIVGEIKDEYDEETEAIINETSGSYLVKGDTEIKELEEIFQVELEDREYNTIGGLITHTLNRLPVKGEIVNVKGLEIEILDVDEKRIRRVRIKKSDKNQGNKNEREEI
jgi:CBS domain containing-hemolysin-like protein